MSWVAWLKAAGFSDEHSLLLSGKLESNDLQVDIVGSIQVQHLEQMGFSLGHQVRFMNHVNLARRESEKGSLREGREFFEKKQNFNRGGAREVFPERKALFEFAKRMLSKM
jgi:hypothetical protein